MRRTIEERWSKNPRAGVALGAVGIISATLLLLSAAILIGSGPTVGALPSLAFGLAGLTVCIRFTSRVAKLARPQDDKDAW
jgi:hypothetical protein